MRFVECTLSDDKMMNLLNLMYFCIFITLKINFNKFSGIANPEKDTPNMRNQHLHHLGEI